MFCQILCNYCFKINKYKENKYQINCFLSNPALHLNIYTYKFLKLVCIVCHKVHNGIVRV